MNLINLLLSASLVFNNLSSTFVLDPLTGIPVYSHAQIHNDHLGGTNVVTDETATQVQYEEYEPYGAPEQQNTGASVTSHLFTGKELDDSTGLYDYAARQYDPKLGRFITPDTVEPKLTNPQTLNRYSYTLNNPLRYTDPSGNVPIDYMTDPFFLAVSWDAYQSDPTVLNAVAFGVDAVLTAVPYFPALGGVGIRAGARGLSKLGDAISASKAADKAGDAGKAIGKVDKKVIILGENMKDRVIPYAKKTDAEYYIPRRRKPMYTDAEMLEKDRKWTGNKIKQGYNINDIGRDPKRTDIERTNRLPFYQTELKEVQKAINKGYRGYKRVKLKE